MKKAKYLISIFALIAIILIVGYGLIPEKMPNQKSEIKNAVVLGLAGDTMLGRLVNEKISDVGDYKYPWGNMLEIMKNTDVNLVNLETTLTKSEKEVPKVFNFKADPDKVECLTEARVDVVSLANNHSLDYDVEGLIETLEVLDETKILHAGAGKNIEEAKKPVIIEKNGVKIGIIGTQDNEPGWLADRKTPGTYYVMTGDIGKVEKEITDLRKEVDILIYTTHWGPNMREKPPKEFQKFARQLIALGVDIFHGHSAHIFQGIEVYNGGLILYDTGDFVDDYYVTPELRNDRSFFYLIGVDKSGIQSVQLIPTLISNMQVNKASDSDYIWSVERLKQLSKEFGTIIEEMDGGVFVQIMNHKS